MLLLLYIKLVSCKVLVNSDMKQNNHRSTNRSFEKKSTKFVNFSSFFQLISAQNASFSSTFIVY